jgi:single-strand DNA-binding protein
MAYVNRVMLLGNLGHDPELRHTPRGHAVATLSIATSHVIKDENDHPQTVTDWHRVVVWDKQAELCSTYLRKGRAVLVEGRLQPREWTDHAGVKHQAVEVVARQVHFLGNTAGAAPAEEAAAQF